MARFNQLQANYGAHGLEVLGANYVDNDTDIQNFMTTYGVQYGIASVADSSGYTVPMFSTVFAIDADGLILWSGSSDLISDNMVESWLGISGGGGGGDDESCSSGTSRHRFWLAPLAVLVAAFLRRRLMPVRRTP